MLVVKLEKYNLFIPGIQLGKELKWGPNEVAYVWVQNRWKAYINYKLNCHHKGRSYSIF